MSYFTAVAQWNGYDPLPVKKNAGRPNYDSVKRLPAAVACGV